MFDANGGGLDVPGGGSGSALHPAILIVAGTATLVATVVSSMSIYLHLKNYRKPMLQRMVIRIILMVPIYAVSSLISLFSLEAAFVIDVIRDIYEAFVIYCFFQLLLGYLGGERSLLISVHGRPPKHPPFPMSIFQPELDISDPHTFLFLKRGILQYVQVKPVLAVATLILKATGKYNEGNFRADSGYLYVSIVYNASICLALYCLAMFWLCINDDLKPFRPMPKFLCVKGILFFSFWQSIAISILVSAGAIKQLGPYTDKEHISLALTDTLICLEMPIFAFAHMYAFSHRDYMDPHVSFAGRMPMFYAIRDAFGIKDVVEDTKATLFGKGMDYREFEPSEGHIHQGLGRERRIRAGLRYSKGGKGKYWLPQPAERGRVERGVSNTIARFAGRDHTEEVRAPLLSHEADDVWHNEDDMAGYGDTDGFELPFGDIDEEDEALFQDSKQYLFGDYHYPCIDVSSEAARMQMWNEEERILRDERSAWFSGYHNRASAASPSQSRRAQGSANGYGALGTSQRTRHDSDASAGERHIDYEADRIAEGDASDVKLKWTKATRTTSGASSSPRHLKPPEARSRTSSLGSSPGPARQSPRPDAIDLVVEDGRAAEAAVSRERRHGEPAVRGPGRRTVYRRRFVPGEDERAEEIEEEREERMRVGREADLGRVARAVAEVDEEEEARLGEVVHDDADARVARVQTPPVHARVDIPADEDNPWA